MSENRYFKILPDHLKLLRAAYVTWDACEFGAPAIDCKRPYGNSSVYEDIAGILGWELFEDADGDKHMSRDQRHLASVLHSGTQTVLQIILATGEMKTGEYEADPYDRNWRLK